MTEIPSLYQLCCISFVPDTSVFEQEREELHPNNMRNLLFPDEWYVSQRWFPEGIDLNRQPALILERRGPLEECLPNPVRWNPFKWRVAYVNTQGFTEGVLGLTTVSSSRPPDVYYVGEIRLRNILRSMESNSKAAIIECAWVNQADVNLMLPEDWEVPRRGNNQRIIAEMEQAEEDKRSSKRVRREG
jgi:hypothetical protein